MQSSGQMGDQPLWHRVTTAARWLGVAPWELRAQPLAELLKAELAMSLEPREQE